MADCIKRRDLDWFPRMQAISLKEEDQGKFFVKKIYFAVVKRWRATPEPKPKKFKSKPEPKNMAAREPNEGPSPKCLAGSTDAAMVSLILLPGESALRNILDSL